MKIGMLLDPYGEKSPGGLGRAVYELARSIIADDPTDTFTVFLKKKPSQPPTFPGNNWSLSVLESSQIWLTGARRMPRSLDWYLFLTPVIPLFFRPRRSVVVALDFAYLELPVRTLGEWFRTRLLYFVHLRSLWIASHVVAISEATKASTIRHFHIAPEKITVIPIGYIVPDSAEEPMAVPERFFLFAGALKERKNVRRVIEGFELFHRTHPDIHLLIAGKTSGAYYESLADYVREHGLTEHVRFVGYVTDGQLAYLYRKALALVFPSLIEGFGMPILEAMHVGLPVITSSHGSLAEVAGDAALLVDAYAAASIAEGMERIATDPTLRTQLSGRGNARARQFSFEKAGEQVVALYTRLYAKEV